MGYNVSGTIGNSYATGAVTGTYAVGGLVGYNGYNLGVISNSYSTATVTGTSEFGGLVGLNYGTISNSHYDVDTVSINGGHLLTTGGLYDAQYQDWFSHGLSLNIANYAATLPFDSATGSYVVTSVQGIKDLLGFADVASYKFRLGANIDLSATPEVYIPYFSAASFDGGGHTISNLLLNRPHQSEVGLFGVVQSNATIANLGVVNASVTGSSYVGGLTGATLGAISNSYTTGSITGSGGSDYVGGLAGSSGAISNSYSTATVTGVAFVGGLVGNISVFAGISNSYATGNVTGYSYVGGLVGYYASTSTISNSYATGAVTGGGGVVGGLAGLSVGTISNSYATGAVTGGNQVGGLVGWNYLNGNISNSYATGTVTGSSAVGGLVGNNSINGSNSPTVSNSYWDTTTSGTTVGIGTGTLTGATGLTTAQAMQQSSYSGWNFANTWQIVNGATRPTLQAVGLNCVVSDCWTGAAGDHLWFTNGNWSTGLVPTAGQSVLMNLTGQAPVVVSGANTNIGSLTLAEDLTVSNGANFGVSSTFTLNSGIATFNGAGTTSSFVMQGGTLAGSGSFAVTNSFSQAGGTINTTGNLSITQAAGNLVIANTINAANIALAATVGNINIQDTSVTAAGTLDVTAGNALNVTSIAAPTLLTSTGAQNIAVGAGGLTLSGAGGSVAGGSAQITQTGAAGTQTITVNGGGNVQLNGGAGSGNGNLARISASGTAQNITFNAGGTLTLTGGTVGNLNFAQIIANNGTVAAQTQTITGATGITLLGGLSGGGIDANNGEIGNFAQIANVNGSQSISVGAGGITMTGGGGALTDNKTSIIQGSIAQVCRHQPNDHHQQWRRANVARRIECRDQCHYRWH